jgi:type I restriction enzyme, S subunit
VSAWHSIRLRRLLKEPAVGGTWGSDPGDDELDVGCVRGTDFDHVGLVVNEERLPTRSVSRRDYSRRRLHIGDLVLEKSGGGEQQPVGRCVRFTLDVPCVPTNFACRLRPGPLTSDRFLAYLLTSLYSLGVTRRAIKQTTGIQNLDTESFLQELVRVPDRPTQERIADFLDAETARIDVLIEKKRELIAALSARANLLFSVALEVRGLRWASSLDHPVASDGLPIGWRVAHLSVLLDQLTNGYVGPTRDLLVEEGVRYVQSLHIKGGKIDFARHPYYVPPTWHNNRPRIHLRPSDVLIVQTGDIGQVAVVPADFGPASCHALQIARVRRDLISGEYLGAYLQAPFGRDSLLSRTTGALHPHLEGGIRDIRVVVPPLDVQRDVVREVEHRTVELNDVRSAVRRQIELLVEHRHALITATVTGELDLSVAA